MPKRDLTLQDPRCVFQQLKSHFVRYTPEMVQQICGISLETFHAVAEKLVAASGPEKTAAICYALGWTQHSKGVQVIRTASILQLLLGNIGRPGGGILALRGHASIQGSTDIPTLYDILPGYLSMPRAGKNEDTLDGYLKKNTKKTGLWANYPKYFISLLKSYYGARATKENDFGFDWMPKITGDHSFFEFLYDMFPAAGHAEKEGAFTNTQRLLQWRKKAVEPPGECRSEGWFMHQLAKRLIAKANASDNPLDGPLRALDWWYPRGRGGRTENGSSARGDQRLENATPA